ncbi:hypothetical protein [Spirosoma radiotolerans]|uniref:Uncharacterized protein n=1 Tax=Spirosoma radiotolerans TaxID=1379870 RepID=A0A0E3V722_9BACT|nr:hypothetical protein [Spirosoma radiotolerans]AKD55061.1 hypothetical protein SD10_09220 [Spirosoma radiotolerans]
MEKKPNEEKERQRQRFVEFLGIKPDLTEIAERTGILRQTLYYLTKGGRNSSVTAEIHRKMSAAYPDYDMDWVMSGVRRAKSRPVAVTAGEERAPDYPAHTESPVSTSETKLLEVENAGLKRENELLRQTVEILRSMVGDQLKKDMEGSKSESVNDPTRGKQLAIGLNWGIKKVENSMIKIPFTSVRPMSRTWPYPMRRQP